MAPFSAILAGPDLADYAASLCKLASVLRGAHTTLTQWTPEQKIFTVGHSACRPFSRRSLPRRAAENSHSRKRDFACVQSASRAVAQRRSSERQCRYRRGSLVCWVAWCAVKSSEPVWQLAGDGIEQCKTPWTGRVSRHGDRLAISCYIKYIIIALNSTATHII